MPRGNDRIGVSFGWERIHWERVQVARKIGGFWKAGWAGRYSIAITNISALAALSSCCDQVHDTEYGEFVATVRIGGDRFSRGVCPDRRIRPVFIAFVVCVCCACSSCVEFSLPVFDVREFGSRAIRGEFAYNRLLDLSGTSPSRTDAFVRCSEIRNGIDERTKASVLRFRRIATAVGSKLFVPSVAFKDSIEP